MTKWEYRAIQMPSEWVRGLNQGKEPKADERIEATLNALGAVGWEAVNLMVAGDYNGRVLLKRPRP